MTLSEYQEQAKRTLGNATMDNLIMGVIGETGEIIDYLKKVIYHGHPLDKMKLELELGDLAWYVTSILTLNQRDFTDAEGYADSVVPRNLNQWWRWLWINIQLLVEMADSGDIAATRVHAVFVMDNIKKGAEFIGSSLERVLELNNKKLLERYPDGFDKDKSVNRRDAHEGQVS